MMNESLLIFASRNQGKLQEYQTLLGELSISLKCLNDFDEYPDIREKGQSLSDNAAIKARTAAAFYNLPAFSDDTGLEVFALDGAPGVYSSRYAGKNATDEQNIRKLLHELRDEPVDERGARFRTVICLCVPQPGGRFQEYYFEGECDGLIATESSGCGGFGYDPVFYVPSLEMTFAQAGEDEKNRISHRHMAALELAEFLEQNFPFSRIVEN